MKFHCVATTEKRAAIHFTIRLYMWAQCKECSKKIVSTTVLNPGPVETSLTNMVVSCVVITACMSLKNIGDCERISIVTLCMYVYYHSVTTWYCVFVSSK